MAKGYQSNPSIYLLPDEKIVFKTNPHWLFLVIPDSSDLPIFAHLFFLRLSIFRQDRF